MDFFKERMDAMPSRSDSLMKKIRDWFFSCEWYQVYDLIEFLSKITDRSIRFEGEARIAINDVLKQEMAGYRLVDNLITPITAEEEVSAIESALNLPEPMKAVKLHLTSALDKLADRGNPDYRNSIKESISGVEAMCRLITGSESATLGDALGTIERKSAVGLHRALKDSFNKLYGWTNDAQGIRHAMLDESSLDQEDAKFMLVSCSAFINYLVVKAAKAGLSF